MEFGLPIGTFMFCVFLMFSWFSKNPIFLIWCCVGLYIIGNRIKEFKIIN